jgi:TonB family protein
MRTQEFVSRSAREFVNGYPQGREMVRDAFPVIYGGREFFRADHKQTFSSTHVEYSAFAFTKFRGFFIGESLSAPSPQELDRAVDSLRGISFQDDQINPKCSMSADDGTIPGGVVGGIISSKPSVPPDNAVHPIRVRVSQAVAAGLLIKKVQPHYPEEARRQGIHGVVFLVAEINTKGDVEDLKLMSGDPQLVAAAMEAVKRWKYKPYLLDGQPVNVETQIAVSFSFR